MTEIFKSRKSESRIGQAELLVAAVFVILFSGIVVAQNVTNITGNLTGNLILDPELENLTGNYTIEAVKTIQVFADTNLEISANNIKPIKGEEIFLNATLLMDNSSGVPDQYVEFYMDGGFVGSTTTDSVGTTSNMFLSTENLEYGNHILKAEFLGSDYLNPSSSEIEIIVKINVTENVTEPEIRIVRIEAPGVVNQTEEFEVEVFLTSLKGNSTNVSVKIESPMGLVILGESVKYMPEVNENEMDSLVWRLKANSVGNYTLGVYAESQEQSRDNSTFEIQVLYLIPTGITYDPETDTINVVSDGKTCTEENPCEIDDVYFVDQLRNWDKVKKIRSYFSFSSNLVVGDGEKETWLYSESKSINLRKPVEVLRNGNLRFGNSIDGFTSGGSFIQTNVPPEDQLTENSALLVRSGGSLYLYGSSYKVFHPTAENNIYCEDGSDLFMERFTLQRAEGSGEVILYVPSDAEIGDLLVVSGGRYIRKTENVVLESRTEGYVE